MTRAPSSVRIAATVLLPAPIPPVSPMIGAAIAAVAIPSRAASRGSPHVFNRLDHEVHDGDLVRHAVQLEATVKVLRDAGRQLRPDFLGLHHLCRLFLRSRWTPRTTPTPATTLNLLSSHLLGNSLGWTTGTAWAPRSTNPATTTA